MKIVPDAGEDRPQSASGAKPKELSQTKSSMCYYSSSPQKNNFNNVTRMFNEIEHNNLDETFKKLSLYSNIKEPPFAQSSNKTSKFETVKKKHDSKNKFDASTSSDTSDDDELIPKGPERMSKKTKSQRQQNIPYSEMTISNKAHHCGGEMFLFNRSNLVDHSSYQSLPLEQPKNQAQDVSQEELMAVFMSMPDYQIEKMNVAVKQYYKDESETTNSKEDNDSAYDTSSPNSSVSYSPMPNSTDAENSPYRDSDSPLYSSSPDFEANHLKNNQSTFKVPSTTITLNIPVKPITSVRPQPEIQRRGKATSLPSSPILQRHSNIAPECEIVQEVEMTKPAANRIIALLNKTLLEVEWIRILNDDFYYREMSPSSETRLMLLLRNPKTPRFYEVLHSQLELINKQKMFTFLKYINCKGESALSIAIFECSDRPILARYIVDILSQNGEEVDQIDSYGNSIIHQLAGRGDKYVHVLAELLNAKRPDGSPCFKINRTNNLCETPLHIASKKHDMINFPSLAITKVLIKHNAKVLMLDSNGYTPIHLAVKNSCDQQLLKALLSQNVFSKTETPDHLGNTALHYAAARNDLPKRTQAEVMKQLIESGCKLKTLNHNNKTAQSFLLEDRKHLL